MSNDTWNQKLATQRQDAVNRGAWPLAGRDHADTCAFQVGVGGAMDVIWSWCAATFGDATGQ